MSVFLAQIAGDNIAWANQTSVHPVGLTVLAVLGLLVFALPRRWSLLPLLVLACFVPAAQRIVVMGLDFSFLRILVIAYWVRILAFQDFKGLRLIAMDYAVAAWILLGSLVYILQWAEMSAVTNRTGYIYESLGIYVTFRCLLRSWADVERTILILALVSLPAMCFFVLEQLTGRNLFSVMGGVPPITDVREGRLRAQGAFSHPIMAGCFFAIVMVLASGFFMAGRQRTLMLGGTIAAAFVVLACASSTPVLAVLSGGLAMSLAFVRPMVRWIRVGTVVMLVLLHFVMQAPVWHLIARVSAVGGSTGWHRYHLIDKTIAFFPEWFLLGTKTTAHWGRGLSDVTNQYILEGVRGGLLGMTLFVTVIVLGFRAVGKALRSEPDRGGLFWLKWAVGASLFTHCMSFIGVSYFGQTTVSWFLTLALAATISQLPSPRPKPKPKPRPKPKQAPQQNGTPDDASNPPRLAQGRPNHARLAARGRPGHQLQHEGHDPGVPADHPRRLPPQQPSGHRGGQRLGRWFGRGDRQRVSRVPAHRQPGEPGLCAGQQPGRHARDG